MKTIKFDRKKIFLTILLIILLLPTLFFIYGFWALYMEEFKGRYINTGLPSPYKIEKFNKITNDLTIPIDETHSKVLLDGIVDYYIKDDYILILRMNIKFNDMKIIYTNQKEYWVLEYKAGKWSGPMNEPEFYWFRRNHGLLSVHLTVPDIYWSRCCQK